MKSFIERNVIKVLSIVVFLAIILRVLWILKVPSYPMTDFMWYHTKATELSQGKGFLNGFYPDYIGLIGNPTSFRPIGYPATLAFLYYFFGNSFLVSKVLNIFLSSLIIILIFIISRKQFNLIIALISSALYAFLPLSIAYCSITSSEILFSFLLCLSIYTLINKKFYALTGILIGLMSLVRPIGLYFIFVYIVYIIFQKNIKPSTKMRQSIIITIFCIASICPWLARNYIHYHSITFSSNSGYVLYINNNPYATGVWSDPFKYPNSPMTKYLIKENQKIIGFDEINLSKEGSKLAIDWIINNPKKFISLGLKRLSISYWTKLEDILWCFTLDHINAWSDEAYKYITIEKTVYKPFNLLVLIYILLTSIQLFFTRSFQFNQLILLIFLYFTFMIFCFEGNARYAYPMHPLFSIGVTFLLYNTLKSIRHFLKIPKRRRPENFDILNA